MPSPRARPDGRAVAGMLAFALLVALAACTGATGGPGGPSTALQTSAASTPGAAHVAAFGGDCSALFSEAEVSRLVGTAVAAGPAGELGSSASALSALGGLACGWNTPDSAPTHYDFVALVLPQSAVDGANDETPYCDGTQGLVTHPGEICFIDAVGSGFWLSATVTPVTGTTYASVFAAADNLRALFRQRAQAIAAPFLPPPARGAWSKHETCASLAAKSNAAAAVKSPGLVAHPLEVGVGLPDAFEAALDAAGYLNCAWDQPGGAVPAHQLGGFFSYVQPGAAKVNSKDDFSGWKRVSIPGVERAFVHYVDHGVDAISVFDGVNYLGLATSYPGVSLRSIAPAITAIVASLNSGG